MNETLSMPHFPLNRLSELVELGQSFYAEGCLPGRFDPTIFERTWQQLLSSGMGELLTLQIEGRIVGAIGAIIYPDPNDGDLVATEMFWYVLPAHRGRGLKLLYLFEKWANERGARRLVMVHLQNLMPDALKNLYLNRGYRPIETHYIKEM